jgi:hypothetical protein
MVPAARMVTVMSFLGMLLVVQRRVQPRGELVHVLGLTFPDDQHSPSVLPERSYVTPISGNISLPFRTPEIRICLRYDSPVFASVHVPKTSMHKDHFSRARKHDVRFP